MKRGLFLSLILFVVSVTSFSSIVAAQGPPRPDPRAEVVRAYLALDEAQFRSLLTLLQSRAEAIEPLVRAVAEQERELARLLRSPNPEPSAIGSVVITLRGTRQQIEAAEDTFRNGFRGILNEAQIRKLAGLERFIENQQAAPAFLTLGLIEVNLAPEPRRTIQKSLGLDLMK